MHRLYNALQQQQQQHHIHGYTYSFGEKMKKRWMSAYFRGAKGKEAKEYNNNKILTILKRVLVSVFICMKVYACERVCATQQVQSMYNTPAVVVTGTRVVINVYVCVSHVAEWHVDKQ